MNALLAVGCGIPPLTATAVDYPDWSVTMIVPNAPCGSVDALARLVRGKLSDALGQPIIIENKGGASGNIGATYLAQSKPDGYMIGLLSNAILATKPTILKYAKFDPRHDFAPSTNGTPIITLVVVDSSVPVQSIPELLDHARKHHGTLSYGTPGVGAPHQISERVQLIAHNGITIQ